MIAPDNNIIVQVKTKYIRNFTKILRMAAIQNNTSIEPADYVNIIGTVVSVPKRICDKREYNGFSTADIRPGDTALFSSSVIYEFANTSPDQDPIYKNMFYYNAQEYFVCDVTKLFAVVRDTKIRMQNGYVMVENFEKKAQIHLPQHIAKAIKTTTATVSYIGKPLTHLRRVDVEHGDVVFFNPNVLQQYQVNEKKFGIISQHHILARKIPDYEEFGLLD
jgi:co-chaperonin GroES (HSP10)